MYTYHLIAPEVCKGAKKDGGFFLYTLGQRLAFLVLQLLEAIHIFGLTVQSPCFFTPVSPCPHYVLSSPYEGPCGQFGHTWII